MTVAASIKNKKCKLHNRRSSNNILLKAPILIGQMKKESVQNYWKQFLASLPSNSLYHAKTYIAEGWGDGPVMADELGRLIARGIKTATCSSLWEWEAEGNPIPHL